jgi:hypothetical protein
LWDHRIAYLCAVAYMAAGVGILKWIAPSYPLEGDETSAITFVYHHGLAWRMGWGLVMLATTLQLILFSIITSRLRPAVGAVGSAVLLVGGFGIIIVWVCSLVNMIAQPQSTAMLMEPVKNAHQLEQVRPFYMFQKNVSLPQTINYYLFMVANTFLWASGLLLSVLCLRDKSFPRWLIILGCFAWFAGSLITIGTILNDNELRMSSLQYYFPLISLWAFMVGLFYLLEVEESS